MKDALVGTLFYLEAPHLMNTLFTAWSTRDHNRLCPDKESGEQESLSVVGQSQLFMADRMDRGFLDGVG